MFNFFNKKPQPDSSAKIATLSEAEINIIKERISEKTTQLAEVLKIADPDTSLVAKLYEEMGLIIAKWDKDQAINYLETSLTYQLTIGDGYKQLMSLYNQKRAQAAQNGDSDGIDKWMNKMDDMRQIAKKVIITG